MKITEFKGSPGQPHFKVDNAARNNLVRAIQQAEENSICFSDNLYA